MTTLTTRQKVTTYQQLIAGIQKNAPNLVLIIASQTYTTAQVVTILQSLPTGPSRSTWTRSRCSHAWPRRCRLLGCIPCVTRGAASSDTWVRSAGPGLALANATG